MRVLADTGLADDARRRVGEFSLGMRQRLGLAAAMLGDPAVLVLDEPTNGLDPQGIRWLRGYVRRLAAEGRTVLVSSHALSEVEQTAEHVLVITNGRLVRSSRHRARCAPRPASAAASAHPNPLVCAPRSTLPVTPMRSRGRSSWSTPPRSESARSPPRTGGAARTRRYRWPRAGVLQARRTVRIES